MKKIFVYPCGTKIGLEIYRAAMYSPHYILYGGSSNHDHGRFVYKRHIDRLPFITDESQEDEIIRFEETIKKYGFDYIYPAMDGVLTVFSRHRDLLSSVLIAPGYPYGGVSYRRGMEWMKPVLIIAEAGVNHNGDLELAYKMIDKAKEAGADIVKFQTAVPENVISRYAGKAEYQKHTTGEKGSQLDMVQKLMLRFEDFVPLKKYCEELGIGFLSTPFDLESIDFLDGLGCSFWKVPSGEITNLPYLLRIAKTGKPVILSTGMSTLEEVSAAFHVLKGGGSKEITLLHCTTEYPAPVRDVNLRAMLTLKEKFRCRVGYSDHTSGIEIAIAAAAMGAAVIEKHFTLDRGMAGPDHKASLEPDGLSAMVKAIRNVEQAMGDECKRVSGSEMANIKIARKSIVASKDIKKGERLSERNITTKRPGDGISPMEWFNVIGTDAVKDFRKDELIEL